MKKTLVILAVLLSTIELFRYGHATALVLSLVIAQIVYGKDIYKAWLRMLM